MCSFGSSSGSQHQDTSAYGTNTPTLSPQYQSMFNSYAKSMGFDPSQWMPGKTAPTTAGAQGSAAPQSSGTNRNVPVFNPQTGQMESGDTTPAVGADYTGPSVQSGPTIGTNSTQSSALDWIRNSLTNSPVQGATKTANADLTQANDWNKIVGNRINAIATQDAPQAQAFTSAGAPTIKGESGSDYMGRYMSPYLQDVVGSTQALYDRNTDRGLNTLRASRDAGSAFGDRANLGDGQFLSDSAMNEGATLAQLKNLGFTNAAGFGAADAGNAQAAGTQNAANTLSNNQFNAGAQNANSQFNVNAKQRNTDQKITANSQALQAISNSVGVSKDILAGVVTADGIDTAKANQLFTDGTITSAQLAALVSMATSGNGYSYTQNAKSDGTTEQSSTVI